MWAAPVVPPAAYNIVLGYTPAVGPGQPPGTSNTFSSPGAYSLGPASASVTGFPTATATVHGASSASTAAEASVDMFYDFQIVGPAASSIPIDVAGMVSAKATGITGSNGASATIRVTADTQQYISTNCGAGALTMQCTDNLNGAIVGHTGTLSQVLHVTGQPGVNYELLLHAAAGSNYGGTADAMFDPLISIDPGFATASAYSIVVSEGVGNTATVQSAVPEPGSVLMLISGAASLALLRVVRRRQQA